jgi:hypothetical protein
MEPSTLAANDRNRGRWVVNLRQRLCYLLSLLRIHRPDCEHCTARVTCWGDTLKRLEELNWRTQPSSLKPGDHEDNPPGPRFY